MCLAAKLLRTTACANLHASGIRLFRAGFRWSTQKEHGAQDTKHSPHGDDRDVVPCDASWQLHRLHAAMNRLKAVAITTTADSPKDGGCHFKSTHSFLCHRQKSCDLRRIQSGQRWPRGMVSSQAAIGERGCERTISTFCRGVARRMGSSSTPFLCT